MSCSGRSSVFAIPIITNLLLLSEQLAFSTYFFKMWPVKNIVENALIFGIDEVKLVDSYDLSFFQIFLNFLQFMILLVFRIVEAWRELSSSEERI